MSVLGILSTLGSVKFQQPQANQANWKGFKQEFQQLGQDLQSGNLSAAQQDFTTLQQLGFKGLGNASATTQTDNPILQEMNQLSQDLQSGNTTAAQQDLAKLKLEFGQMGAMHRHHHMRTEQGSGPVSQLFQQLGQALQSGNLSTAQQMYASVQQDLQQLGQNMMASQGAGALNSLSVSV